MTSEIIRNGKPNGRLVQTPMTKWVMGITAACLLTWMGWVSSQLLKGGRFTAEDGQFLAEMLHRHEDLEGHQVMVERVTSIKSDQAEMKRLVEENRNLLLDLERNVSRMDSKLDVLLKR